MLVRSRLAPLVLMLACGASGRTTSDGVPHADGEAPAKRGATLAAQASAPPDPPTAEDYTDALSRIEARRKRLASALAAARTEPGRHAVLEQARAYFLRAVTHDLFPAWMGTPWAMNGTAERPGAEPIACGYFVATILRDAGVELRRVRFGQATALRIQEATRPPTREVHRFFSIPPAALAERIAALGDGLYVIGLNVHVGFVRVDDGDVRFVHSSYTDDVVVDEPLATAAAIANSQPAGYFVSELMSTDAAVERWLTGVEAVLPPA